MQSPSRPTNRRPGRKRLKLTPRFWLMIFILFLVYMAGSYAAGFVQIWRMQNQIAEIKAEITAAESRNDELKDELSYLQSDEYVEKVAREELGLVKPGETAIIVTSPDQKKASP